MGANQQLNKKAQYAQQIVVRYESRKVCKGYITQDFVAAHGGWEAVRRLGAGEWGDLMQSLKALL